MKFSIVANTKQENIREILKKVIGFVDDFELDMASANFLGLKGVEIKDLSGAGDTFLAGLVCNYLNTNDIKQAIIFANECATKVVQRRGVNVV